MKFKCEKCGTRYTIADEKVRRKVLKIRCKICEHVMIVRDAETTASPSEAAVEPAPRAPRPRFVEAATQVSDARSALADVEWYAAPDGEQVGPMPLERLEELVRTGHLKREDFVWNETLDDWLPAEEIGPLRTAFERRERPAAALRQAAPRPAAEPPRVAPPPVGGPPVNSPTLPADRPAAQFRPPPGDGEAKAGAEPAREPAPRVLEPIAPAGDERAGTREALAALRGGGPALPKGPPPGEPTELLDEKDLEDVPDWEEETRPRAARDLPPARPAPPVDDEVDTTAWAPTPPAGAEGQKPAAAPVAAKPRPQPPIEAPVDEKPRLAPLPKLPAFDKPSPPPAEKPAKRPPLSFADDTFREPVAPKAAASIEPSATSRPTLEPSKGVELPAPPPAIEPAKGVEAPAAIEAEESFDLRVDDDAFSAPPPPVDDGATAAMPGLGAAPVVPEPAPLRVPPPASGESRGGRRGGVMAIAAALLVGGAVGLGVALVPADNERPTVPDAAVAKAAAPDAAAAPSVPDAAIAVAPPSVADAAVAAPKIADAAVAAPTKIATGTKPQRPAPEVAKAGEPEKPAPPPASTAREAATAHEKPVASAFAGLEQGHTQVALEPAGGSTADLPDTLSQGEISAVINRNRRSLEGCYQRQLKKDASMRSAKATLKFQIERTGKASGVRIDKRFDGTVLQSCLEGVVQRWTFPRFRGEPVAVEFPLIFQGTL